jgi:cell shape-determining protein MreC
VRRRFGVDLRQEDVVLALRYWAIGVALCGLLLGMDVLRILHPVRGVIEQQLWSVDRRVFEIRRRAAAPFEALFGVFNRYERIAALEEQLSLAAVDQQELKKLQAQVEFQQRSEYKASTLAELYVKDSLAVVGAGEINGIMPGMAVTDKHGVLVGRIESVGRYVSRVERVGAMNFPVPAQTVSGMARGVVYFDGNAIVFGEVLQTEALEIGDIVVTGGASGLLPTGLVVGQVTAVEGDQADVTKKGILKLLAQDQGWVAVW